MTASTHQLLPSRTCQVEPHTLRTSVNVTPQTLLDMPCPCPMVVLADIVQLKYLFQTLFLITSADTNRHRSETSSNTFKLSLDTPFHHLVLFTLHFNQTFIVVLQRVFHYLMSSTFF